MGITTYASTFALSGGRGRASSHGDRGAPAADLPREAPLVRPVVLVRLLDRTWEVTLVTSEPSSCVPVGVDKTLCRLAARTLLEPPDSFTTSAYAFALDLLPDCGTLLVELDLEEDFTLSVC